LLFHHYKVSNCRSACKIYIFMNLILYVHIYHVNTQNIIYIFSSLYSAHLLKCLREIYIFMNLHLYLYIHVYLYPYINTQITFFFYLFFFYFSLCSAHLSKCLREFFYHMWIWNRCVLLCKYIYACIYVYVHMYMYIDMRIFLSHVDMKQVDE
jgi:hypothetical protein